jgi:hypothetical protein
MGFLVLNHWVLRFVILIPAFVVLVQQGEVWLAYHLGIDVFFWNLRFHHYWLCHNRLLGWTCYRSNFLAWLNRSLLTFRPWFVIRIFGGIDYTLGWAWLYIRQVLISVFVICSLTLADLREISVLDVFSFQLILVLDHMITCSKALCRFASVEKVALVRIVLFFFWVIDYGLLLLDKLVLIFHLFGFKFKLY